MTAVARRHEVGWNRLFGRVLEDVELPLPTVRRLRPHAARRATTVPLLALEIVEATIDQGRVGGLVGDRPEPTADGGAAARFSLGYEDAQQLHRIAGRRKGGSVLLARSIVEAALDGDVVDDLLRGRFDRGEPRPRPSSPPAVVAAERAPPALPLAATPFAAFDAASLSAPNSEVVKRHAGPRWRVILLEEADAHGLTLGDLVGPDRRKRPATARFAAAYRMWRELGMSYPEIGRRLSGRDHTSVLYAIRKHAAVHGLPLERDVDDASPATERPGVPDCIAQLPPRARARMSRRTRAAVLANAATVRRANGARP